MKNMRKLFAVVLGLALVIGILATTSFAATTGTGVFGDPIVCDSISDVPATYTLDGGQELYIKAPIGGQAVTVSDPNGWAAIKNPMTGMAMGTTYDCTTAPTGYAIEFCIMNQNPYMPANIEITVGAPALPDPGTEGNPLPVAYNTNFYAYLMNEALEAGDSDGIWYSIEAHEDGILCVDVNCSADVDYGVDVYAGIYQGVNSEGNPILTYRVAQGDVITIHKYVNPDLYGNIDAASIYVSADIVEGSSAEPVSLKSTEIKVPVTSGDEVYVMDGTREASYSGTGLIVSGYSEAIQVTTVTVNGTEYTDTDGDGTIEIATPGNYYSRPVISIKNGHEWNIGYTLKAVESAKEGYFEPNTNHELEHSNYVEATCDVDGRMEYWYCATCDVYYQDEACTQITNYLSTTITASGHDWDTYEAVVPTCSEGGNIAYQQCFTCGAAQTVGENPIPLAMLGWILGPTEHTLVHFDAQQPACHYNGNVEYWFCSVCEGFWLDANCTQITNSKSIILPATGSVNVQHVTAVDPTCDTNGNIEYWHCTDCEQFWQDEALTQLTNSKNVIIGATNHDWVSFDAVAPTCSEGGNIAYQRCSVCGAAQTAGENPMPLAMFGWILGPTEHTLVHFDAQQPACHYNGNVEYWFCSVCEGFWLDANCTQITNSKSIILPATGSVNLQHVEAVAPNCFETGNIEYWFCSDCEQFWQDEALTQLTNSKNVILPVYHEGLEHYEAVEAGCHSNGNIEYWFCPTCQITWQDITLTQITNLKNVILPATGSENMVHFEALDPGCHSLGNIEYWYCPDCQAYFQDEACTQLTNAKRVILPETGSENLKHVEAVAATTEKEGNIEYWYCPDCGAYFQDEACTQLTNAKRVITPKLEVVPETTVPEATTPEATTPEATTPQTGDATPVAALIAMSVIAVCGLAVLIAGKKKFSV